jgi:hypothetical protein
LAAHCHHLLEVNGWIDDLEANRRQGIDLARQAIRFAPDDPEALATGGFALGYFGEDIGGTIRLIDRSLALNPSFARGWVWSAVLRNFAGQPNVAIEHYNRSLRLSPHDRLGVFGLPLGTAHFFNKQFDDAAAILRASAERAPGFAVLYRFLASCYAQMGRLDEAREVVKRLRAITPVVVRASFLIETRSSGSFFCRACVWRPARRREPGRHLAAGVARRSRRMTRSDSYRVSAWRDGRGRLTRPFRVVIFSSRRLPIPV